MLRWRCAIDGRVRLVRTRARGCTLSILAGMLLVVRLVVASIRVVWVLHTIHGLS